MTEARPYQLTNEQVLYDWLGGETDSWAREQMLDWVTDLANDPWDIPDATHVPNTRAPVYQAMTFVPNVVCVYLIADQFRAIKLIAFDVI